MQICASVSSCTRYGKRYFIGCQIFDVFSFVQLLLEDILLVELLLEVMDFVYGYCFVVKDF